MCECGPLDEDGGGYVCAACYVTLTGLEERFRFLYWQIDRLYAALQPIGIEIDPLPWEEKHGQVSA